MKVQRPVLPALTRFLVLLMALTQISSLHAQSYPSKAIRLIIPFAPGGSTDIVGRMLAARLSEVLGKQVIIDNRPGGNDHNWNRACCQRCPGRLHACHCDEQSREQSRHVAILSIAGCMITHRSPRRSKRCPTCNR